MWQQILEPFEKMRVDNDLVRCFPTQITGEDLFGLTEHAVIRIVESVSHKCICTKLVMSVMGDFH